MTVDSPKDPPCNSCLPISEPETAEEPYCTIDVYAGDSRQWCTSDTNAVCPLMQMCFPVVGVRVTVDKSGQPPMHCIGPRSPTMVSYTAQYVPEWTMMDGGTVMTAYAPEPNAPPVRIA